MNKEDSIIIVGAGIFGLSTALHLASSGYSDVTVFDRHAVDKTRYSYLEGCDGASAGKLPCTAASAEPRLSNSLLCRCLKDY